MIEWIKDNLLPFAVISQNEKGIRLRRGRYVETLGPGIYWFWPLVDDVKYIVAATQPIDLPDKSMTDKNGQTWGVSGIIEYEVEDPRKALLCVQDYDTSIQTRAMALVAEAVYQGMTKPEIETFVMSELPDIGEQWGLSIEEFQLNELCRCDVHRVMGITKGEQK